MVSAIYHARNKEVNTIVHNEKSIYYINSVYFYTVDTNLVH